MNSFAFFVRNEHLMEPLWEGRTKVCLNGPGHMIKLAASPIFGKKLFKSSLITDA